LGKRGELELTDAMRTLGQDGVPIHGVVFSGRRYDTGDRQDYLQATVRLGVEHPELGADFTRWLVNFVQDLEGSSDLDGSASRGLNAAPVTRGAS
jgi:UTP--glucose-1-phosphate uridylyltransferase